MAGLTNTFHLGRSMFVYVNPYTHEYEITDIPTDYDVKHVGPYVGTFTSYYSDQDVYRIDKIRQFDRMSIDELYAPQRTRPNFCFVCHKLDHWSSRCPEKKQRIPTYIHVYVNPSTHDILILSTHDVPPQDQNMQFVGSLTSYCNEYSRYCLKTQKKFTYTSKIPSAETQTTSTQSQTDNIPFNNNLITVPIINENMDTKQNVDDNIPCNSNPITTPIINEIVDAKQNVDEKCSVEKKEKTRTTRKKNCFFCESKKHKKGKICPLIVETENRDPRKRKSEGEDSDIPKKKRKTQ